MSRDLLNKMIKKEKEFRTKEFLAPYIKDSKTAIVKMDNANYKFRITGFDGSGFGIFQPVDPNCAKFVKEADFDQVRQYLDILPKIHFILAYEVEDGWVAYPMHAASAEHNFGLQSEVVVRNVSDCERFDTVVARYDGLHFWFDEMSPAIDYHKAESMRYYFVADEYSDPNRMKESVKSVVGLTDEDFKAFELAVNSWLYFKKMTTEDRLRTELEKGGGELKSYVVRGRHLDVKWKSDTGKTYRSIINKDNFRVFSAGICLAGTDRRFHVKDLPFIMRASEGMALPETNRNLNLDDDGSVKMDYYLGHDMENPEWFDDE